MTILLGVLLYVLCVAFFCTLTGMNRLDEREPQKRRARELATTQRWLSAPAFPPAKRTAGAREASRSDPVHRFGT